jgi:UDP-GlcNAc:undecaprenyl-phosphate GlcNAc-1-phosphate transferase
MKEYALVLLVAAAVTYLLTPLVRRIAVVTHAMHEPRARDTHTKATPLLGGLAMYGGLVAGLVVASRLSFVQDPFQGPSRTEAGLLLAGAFVVVVGFVDDRWGLSAISKLAGQVAAAGILVWSGQALPWLPKPNGGVFSLEPDLSVTLTILLVVVTINAINFIDGLDGLAAGIVAVAALSFLAYSYVLIRTIGSTSQSLPAVSSALLAGICLGFLPHNFYPARIFMGDIGAMLLGLLLAYGPIASTDSLDPALLTNYSHTHALDRFPTILPLLVPAAIFIIPYADLMFAIIRRTRAGKPLMAADRQHLHHRLLNIGHSYRQSVLIMYLWAALFSVTVVSLSLVRTRLVVFAAATVVAVLTLLPVTMPRLRPWRAYTKRKGAAAQLPVAQPPVTRPPAVIPPATRPWTASAPVDPVAPVAPVAPQAASASAVASQATAPAPADPFARYNGTAPPFPGYTQDTERFPGYTQDTERFPGYAHDAERFPGYTQDTERFPGYTQDTERFPGYTGNTDRFPRYADDADPFAGTGPLPRPGRLPEAGAITGSTPFASQAPFASQDPFSSQDPFPPLPGAGPLSGDDPVDGDGPDPFSPVQHPDVRPR